MAKAGVLAAGAAGVGALFVTLRAGIGEFTEASKVAAQTEAVLKSTGGAANVTAEHVDELATSIMRYSGIDDEAVKSGENLLLTFTKIRNEVGKGNDIFDQATVAITDMSVALGQDMKSSAIQVGKALQDPIRGMTALRRVGVAFTDAQVAQVKALVASGRQMDAQKLILRELNTEFGGSAKAAGDTLPGQLNKLRETFNNLAGDLVSKAVPALTSFVGFVAEKGLPKLERFFDVIGESVGPALTKLGDAFKAAAPAIMGVLEPIADVIRENLAPVFEQLQDIGVRAMQAISRVVQDNGPQIRQIFENLGQVISNLAKVVIPLLDFAFTKVLPIAIRVLIPLLAATSEVLAQVSTAVRILAGVITSILVGAFNVASSVAGALATFYSKNLAPVFAVVGSAATVMAGVLKSVLVPAFRVLYDVVTDIHDAFRWFINVGLGIWQRVKTVLPGVVSVITGAFQGLADAIGKVLFLMQQVVHWVDDFLDAIGKVGGKLGFLGKIPGLQHGGPVEAGRAYVVGERGKELFIPNVPGTVVPDVREPGSVSMAGAMSRGGGAATNINLNFYGPAIGTDRSFQDLVRRAFYDVERLNPGVGLAG